MSLKSTFKGFLGETVINLATWLKLDKTVYHRLNNITLPLANGGSTQIDHVIVSTFGIFVIETKNYKGWIYGSERQKQWTQAFPNGSKYKFQNPLRQNYLHIKALADLLALDMSYFHSMVVFIGECELKTRDELPSNVLTGGVITYIKQKQDTLLNADDVQAILQQIESGRFSKSWRTNRAHKAYLKQKLQSREVATTTPTISSQTQTNAPAKQESTPKIDPWSGQVEQDKTPVPHFYTHKPNDSHAEDQTDQDKVYLTPFSVSDRMSNHDSAADSADHHVYKDAESDDNSMIDCPKCGSQMIQRIAKKGARQGQAFYGCSQFPKCRAVINID